MRVGKYSLQWTEAAIYWQIIAPYCLECFSPTTQSSWCRLVFIPLKNTNRTKQTSNKNSKSNRDTWWCHGFVGQESHQKIIFFFGGGGETLVLQKFSTSGITLRAFMTSLFNYVVHITTLSFRDSIWPEIVGFQFPMGVKLSSFDGY